MFKFRLILTIGLFLSFVGFTVISTAQDNDWRLRKTNHFIISYKNASDKFLDKVKDISEEGYYKISKDLGLLRDESWLWEKRANIYIYDSKQEYLLATSMPDWSQGAAVPDKRTVYTYSDSYKFLDDLFIHELTHIILREFVKGNALALWFDEGVATYMEPAKRSTYTSALSKILNKGDYISIPDILAMNFFKLNSLSSAKDNDSNKSGFSDIEKFYIESFSLVNFLMDKYDRYRFVVLCRKVRDGEDFNRAFFSAYKDFKDPQDLENKWKRYYLQR